MSAVMHRIQAIAGISELYSENDLGYFWHFKEELKEQSPQFFAPLIKKQALLTLEYNVLCTQIVHHYHENVPDWDLLTEQVAAALLMSQLLAYLYEHYLDLNSEILQLRKEQSVYKNFMRDQGFMFPNDGEKVLRKKIKIPVREFTASSNWPRLFLVRARRVLNAIVPLAKDLEQFVYLVNLTEKYMSPVVAYVSWLFFIPRLSNNLFQLARHAIPGPWMNDKEKKQTFGTRLAAQFDRRWFELFNDAMWLMAGLLNCFVFLGPLALPGLYINVIFYVADVVSASIRAIREIHRLQKLYNQYEEMRHAEINPAKAAEIQNFQQHLQKQIVLEKARVLLAVVSTSALVAGILISLPLIAIHPVLPLAGACILLSVTILTYLTLRIIQSRQPSKDIQCLNAPHASACSQTFFQRNSEAHKRPEYDEWADNPVFMVNAY